MVKDFNTVRNWVGDAIQIRVIGPQEKINIVFETLLESFRKKTYKPNKSVRFARFKESSEKKIAYKKQINAYKAKRIKILSFENYHGKSEPYCPDSFVKYFEDAAPVGFITKMGKDAEKKSGYTTSQLNILFKDGIIGELQIRGPLVHELSEIEHFLYDIRRGKIADTPLAKYLHKMDDKKFESYLDYLNSCYDYVRDQELKKFKDPVLKFKNVSPPDIKERGIPAALSIDNIQLLYTGYKRRLNMPKKS